MRPGKTPLRVLFISHDSSRAGGTILLLNFLKWLRTDTEFECEVLLKAHGPLAGDFQKIGRTYHYSPRWPEGLIGRLLARLGLRRLYLIGYRRLLRARLARRTYDVIYSNTITNAEIMDLLRSLPCRRLVHVRELASEIERFGGTESVRLYDELCDSWIADSEAVRDCLVTKYRVARKKICVIPEYVPIPAVFPQAVDRDIYGIPANAFVVGAAGWLLWRKGFDLFLQLALILRKAPGDRPIHFVWVGPMSAETRWQLEFDLERTGLSAYVHFVGEQENPLQFFALYDVFLLMSREEPFGIVGLEAALAEVPVICFEKSGGMTEFVDKECGFVVPYLDVQVMAERVMQLLKDPALRDRLGRQARAKVLGHHSLEDAARRLVTELEACAR